jgi:hypothetical protein
MRQARRIVAILVILLAAATFLRAQDTTVYVTKTGAKYHRAGCSSLRSSSIPMAITAAAARYSPCLNCKSPVPSTTPTKAVAEAGVQQKLAVRAATSGRCQATTKKGTQCSRKAKAGSSYCWQHG